MVWIIITILVVGYFIVRAINNQSKTKNQNINTEVNNKQQLVNQKYFDIAELQTMANFRKMEEDIETLKNRKLSKKQKIALLDKHSQEAVKLHEKYDKELEDFKIKVGMSYAIPQREFEEWNDLYIPRNRELHKERDQLLEELNT